VRIPLDYYRILGLPIQATAEQLQQAYRDRTLQLPRREYSEAAIAARRQLLDEAYTVLSNSEQRHTYDAQFFHAAYADSGDRPAAPGDAADPYTPSIEIADAQLVGALLILLELGEYELVLKLGRPYLSSGNASINPGTYGDTAIILADVVLTIAIACLELGREQWQQGQYESAAESLETGQELLLREGLFAALRGEMQSDLYKLRPYRILELLSVPETADSYAIDHQRGLQLLQEMLDERGGIDGTQDDQSGLSVDDFLKFIQQLRSYLTAAEQQALFEAESRRPSAVANYLTVYALAARGFAERRPALIRRAKLFLLRLGMRQDVYLEQSICALLLGQTEEASRALEHSQEYDSLAFIREHSQDSPDLLPGLCLYGERWLQNEVFPYFRDLAQKKASLKEYFADEDVQAYLEELPNEPEPASQWVSAATKVRGAEENGYREFAATAERSYARSVNGHQPIGYGTSATATLDAPPASGSAGTSNSETPPIAERMGYGDRSGAGESRSPQSSQESVHPRARRSSRGRPSPRLDRMLFLVAIGVFAIVVLVSLVSRISRVFAGGGGDVTVLQQGNLSVLPQQYAALVAPPAPSLDQAELTPELAQQVVETWLSAKRAALGESRNIEALSTILVDPVLSRWVSTAEGAIANNWYMDYEHLVSIETAEVSEDRPDEAIVLAAVTETANFYEDGQLNLEESYDSALRVQYNLVRQDGQWRIESMAVQ
jgi:hypothetical protein